MTAQEAELRQVTDGRFGLSDEQREAIRSITDARGIAAMVGFAGSGKSAQSRNRRPWRAPRKPLASWEYAWSRGRDDQAGDVFVIDEAGMIASGQLARVIDRIHAAGAKAVLVGDAMQLQPIQAGAGRFRSAWALWSWGHPPAAGPAWQRQAALDFARGRTLEGLQAYAAHGAVRFHDTVEQAHTQIVTDWMAAHAQGSVLILAHANSDVEALNAGVRAARKAAGELDGPEIQFETARGLKGFTVGDRVLFLKNEMDVKNGMLGTVEGLGIDTLTVRTDRGLVVTPQALGVPIVQPRLRGDGAQAQGAGDRTLVYASALMNRHLTYVALTRHRDDAAVLYAAKQAFASVQDLAHAEPGRLVEHDAGSRLHACAGSRRRPLPAFERSRGEG